MRRLLRLPFVFFCWAEVASLPLGFSNVQDDYLCAVQVKTQVVSPPDTKHWFQHQTAWATHFECAGARHYILPSFIVGVLAAAAMIAFVTFLHRGSASHDPADGLLLKPLGIAISITQLCGMTCFSLPILGSLDLATRIGKDAAFSGQAIGIYMTGSVLGGSCLWLLLQYHPSLWSSCCKTVHLASLALNTVGLLLYSLVITVSYVQPMPFDPAPLLLFSRLLGGCGHGLAGQANFGVVARFWSPRDRPAQIALLILMSQLAIGGGPMCAALARSYSDRSELLLAWSGVVALLAITIWRLFFSVKGPIEKLEDGSGERHMPEKSWRRRRIFGCLAMTACRAYVVSALEVASAMVLETSFHWDLQWVGLAIGVTFLACLPVKAAHGLLAPLFSMCGWIRIMAAFTLIGTSLLAVGSNTSSPWIFLLGDATTFPTIFLADAFTIGIMQQNLLPNGSWFADANNATLYSMMAANGAGRLLGPWLARVALHTGGLRRYVSSQFVACFMFIGAFEILVAPGLEECD